MHGAYVDLCVFGQQHTASFDIVIRAEHVIAVVIVILTVILGVDERRFSALSRRFAGTQPSQIVYITAGFSQVFGADYILFRYRQVLPCQLFAIFAQSESGYRQIEPGVLSAVADAPCVVQDKAHSHIFFAACAQRRPQFCFEIIAFGNLKVVRLRADRELQCEAVGIPCDIAEFYSERLARACQVIGGDRGTQVFGVQVIIRFYGDYIAVFIVFSFQ